MPLTPNGKVDTRLLPYPDTAIIMAQHRENASDDNGASAGKVSGTEKQLLSIFESVLGYPVRVDDNFFEVGGHSISATRVTFKIRQQFKQELPLNLLYKCPTVSAL